VWCISEDIGAQRGVVVGGKPGTTVVTVKKKKQEIYTTLTGAICVLL
jgi:hypothetical protein